MVVSRLTRPSIPRSPARTVRPLRRAGAEAACSARFDGELLALCDGRRSLLELAEALGDGLEGDEAQRLVELTSALVRLERAGAIEPSCVPHAPVKLVLGLEDRPSFHWQLAILFESLHGQLPRGWELLPVICNDGAPLSPELARVLDTYGVRPLAGRDLPRRQRMDFAGGGDVYPPLNRIEALRVAAERAAEGDVLCLMDTDNFLYRELDLAAFPEGDAVCANWLIGRERFFEAPDAEAGGLVHLQGLLDALGAERRFRPGGVTVFLTGATARHEKFVRDCFRFTQVLYLLGRIGGAAKVWHAEMPCFALALTANDIPYDVIDGDGQRFVITRPREIPPGAFYHYYADPADGGTDGAFLHSTWCKQDYRDRDLLRADLAAHAARAATDHERFFFQLAQRARLRLHPELGAVG